jgi:hypothetical protein
MRRLVLVLVLCVTAVSAFAQTKKILLQSDEAVLLKELQSASPKATIVPVTQKNVMQEIGDADAFIGSIRPEEVRAGKKLQWVQVMSAGVEGVLYLAGSNDLRDSNIILTNNQIVQGPEIADMPCYVAHAHPASLHVLRSPKQELRQSPQPYPGVELNAGRQSSVSAGSDADRLPSLGSRHERDWRRRHLYMPIITKIVKPDRLDQNLPEADVVFIQHRILL